MTTRTRRQDAPPSPTAGTLAAVAVLGLAAACVGDPGPRAEPDSAERARAATERSDWRAAAHFWNQALLEGEQPSPVPFVETGRALRALGEEEKAQIVLDRGIELFPEDDALRMMRGDLLRERGFRRAAELDFQEATELDPGNEEAWFQLGRVLVELDLCVRAALCLKENLRLAGPDRETYFLLGRASAENGELAAAVESFRGSLATDAEPTSPGTAAARVDRLVQAAEIVTSERFEAACRPHLEHALGWVDQALDLDPQHAEASYVRGRILELAGRDAEALTAFERAVELDAFHLPAMTRAAELYARRGELARADSVIDRALDLNIADSRRQMLERLRQSWHQ